MSTFNKENANQDRGRKLRHGGIALLITVAVLAAVIAANYAFGALASAKRLYVDMTKSQIYTVSDAADEIISGLGGDTRFEIIFFTPFDEMKKNSYQQQVYEYSDALAEKYDFISVRYIDSISNPEEAARYQNSEVPDLYTTDVVITNGSAWQSFKIESFFTFDSSNQSGPPFAFNAEYRICTALMQMTYDSMLACFTVGHGETTAGSSLCQLFADAGFEVRDIDLSREDIPSDTRILVINAPIYDFGGAYDDVNEIAKVDKFLDGLGNVMVFEDPSVASKLDNLSEFLEEWGIKFTTAKVKDYTNSLTSDGTAVVCDYATEGVASGLNKSLRELDNPPKTVTADVMPIEVLWDSHNLVDVSTVLWSYDTAKAYSLLDDSVMREGAMSLMTVSSHTTIGENNETYYNYLLAAGTSKFADDKYLNGNVYGNGDIIYEAMRAFCKKVVPVDLDFKVYDDNSLDVTNGQAIGWTVAFVAVGPLVAAVIGGIVCVRRKHS